MECVTVWGLGACGGGRPSTLLCAPVAPGRPLWGCPIVLWPGGRWGQGEWLVPKPGNKSPQPSLSIQAGLLMGTQGAWGELVTFPGCVRKLPCAGPMASYRLWGPILEASSGYFLALSAPHRHRSRTPGAHSPRVSTHPSPFATAHWDPSLGAGRMISMGLIGSDSL